MMLLSKRMVAAALIAGSGAAAAAGLGFLAETPLSRFDEEDLKLMNSAVEQALASAKLGAPVRWANGKTASSGEVTPQRAFDRGGRPCRDLRVVNRHRRLEASGVYTMCRDDGQWRLAP
jgi:surface antigen